MKKEDSVFYREIHQQADIFNKIMDFHNQSFDEIALLVKNRNISKVVLAGRGSSDHANKIGSYMFEIYTPMITSIVKPSVITNYKGKVDYSDALVIGISQSGEAKDVAMVIEQANMQNAITVTITNNQNSLMGKLGRFNLDLCCGVEKSVTAGKSFFAQTSILLGIVQKISESVELKKDISSLSSVVKKSYEYVELVEQLSKLVKDYDRFFVFGRGMTGALMEEFELKLQEAAYVDVTAYGSADYFHGPIANTNPQAAMILFMVEETTNYQTHKLLRRFLDEYDIQPIVITNNYKLASSCQNKIVIDEEFDGLRGLYSAIVIVQLFACLISLEKGMNPDQPKGLSKVTVTY